MLEAAAAGLDEQRLAAREHCIEAELTGGRQPHLIGELTELVAANPLPGSVSTPPPAWLRGLPLSERS
jgi:hypothetical protein